MEIKLGPLALNVGDNGVSSIVTSGATGANVGLSSEDVDQLALACFFEGEGVQKESEMSEKAQRKGESESSRWGFGRDEMETDLHHPIERRGLRVPLEEG
jgi:hypothetical protein